MKRLPLQSNCGTENQPIAVRPEEDRPSVDEASSSLSYQVVTIAAAVLLVVSAAVLW